MKVFYKIVIVLIIYALLAIPDNRGSLNIPKENSLIISSRWWGKFAQNLVKFRITNEPTQLYYYNKHKGLLDNHLNELLLQLAEPDDPILDSINYHINKLSALASLVPNKIDEFEHDVSQWRKLLKYQSRFWDTSDEITNKRFFQLITESRLAFESAIIQSNTESTSMSTVNVSRSNELDFIDDLQYESGDLIAFNLAPINDPYVSYIKELPNVYKHLGIVYINEGTTSVIYIDHKYGVKIVHLENFMTSQTTSGVILRLRDDIPALSQKPNLPSLAASTAYKIANNGNYKYDYNFDLGTENLVYDWELINSIYKTHSFNLDLDKYIESSSTINLGSYKDHINAFEIEFDHRFEIAGEWHNSQLLYDSRLLTAATSTIISSYTKSEFINPFLLPVYRIIKGYSMFIGNFGFKEPIPSGITAQTQLVYDALSKKQNKLVAKLEVELTKYESDQNHKATYLKILQQSDEIIKAESTYLK